jgi:hypothetical protein
VSNAETKRAAALTVVIGKSKSSSELLFAP